MEIFNAVKTAAPQVAAVQTIVDGILVQVTAAKALLGKDDFKAKKRLKYHNFISDAPQIVYICVPTRNQVFGK